MISANSNNLLSQFLPKDNNLIHQNPSTGTYITPQSQKPKYPSKQLLESPKKNMKNKFNFLLATTNQKRTQFSSHLNITSSKKNNLEVEDMPSSIIMEENECFDSQKINELIQQVYSKSSQSKYSNPSLCVKKSRKILNDFKNEICSQLNSSKSKQAKIKELEKELLVPTHLKNDEQFKLLVIRKIRKKSNLINCKSARKFEDNYGNNGNKFDSLMTFRKKKISLGTRDGASYSNGKFLLPIKLFDNKNLISLFPLFTDELIGFNLYWQSHFVELTNDDDYDSDEEQIELAKSYCVCELNEAFDYLDANGDDSIYNKGINVCYKGFSRPKKEQMKIFKIY